MDAYYYFLKKNENVAQKYVESKLEELLLTC